MKVKITMIQKKQENSTHITYLKKEKKS